MAKNPRTVHRVMLTAATMEPANAAEAAVVGGIVRSVIDTGHFKAKYVQHYAAEAGRYFAKDIVSVGERIPGAPSARMIREVVSRFMDIYNRTAPPDDGQPVAA